MAAEKTRYGTLAGIVLVSAVLRLFYLIVAPDSVAFENGLAGSDDEKSHMNYVLALEMGNAVPVQTDSPKSPGAFERNAFEYYQPPLSYWLGARVLEASGAHLFALQVRWVRLLSVALGIVQVILCWPIVRRVFRDRADAEAAFAIAALLGAHVKATTFVSNDALAFLLFTLAILVVIWREERPASVGLDVALGAVIAAAWLTKSSASVLVAFVAVAEVVRARARRDGRGALGAGLAILAGTLIAAPWYARNLRVYGELFAISVSHGPKFDYPVTAEYLVGRLLHLPYEMFFAWYVEHPSPLFALLTKLEYVYLAAAIVLFAVGAKRRDDAPLATPAGRLVFLLFALNTLAHAAYSATYGYFGPRQILGAVSAWAVLLALPAIAASRAARGRIPPLAIAAALVLPKHIECLIRFVAGAR
ncbi:MAG: glycosyltransferase family 39 protein [bacterium]